MIYNDVKGSPEILTNVPYKAIKVYVLVLCPLLYIIYIMCLSYRISVFIISFIFQYRISY